jgi:hypothetical protein
MRVFKRLLVLAAFIALPVWAAPAAVVEALVAPVWIDRNGREQALELGAEIRNGDRIRSGEGGRVYIRLAEGSTVKLGENTSFSFYSRSLKPKTAFRSAMDVAAGAFRFTTAALSKVRQRDVTVRVGTVTAGIRGTDFWGKSDRQRDQVVLIEGQIDIRRGGESAELNQPLQAYFAPKGELALPVATITAAELATRARETEIVTGDGGARRNGRWQVVLGQFASEREALEPFDMARGAGYGARIRPISGEAGGWSYVVTLPGLPDEREAQIAADRLKEATGLEGTVKRSTGP